MREVIRPPLWLLLLIYLIELSFVFAIWVAFDAIYAVLAALIATLVIAYIAWSSPMVITVDEEIMVDGAHLELRYIRTVEVLDKKSMSKARTIDADASAFLAIRFWCPTGVKIILDDPRDPTPYWLISSRNPQRLKHAIEA